MRTIEIDEDIYSYLLRNTTVFGERESSVLRRLLGLAPTAAPRSDAASTPGSGVDDPARRLLEFVESPAFGAHRDATNQFLEVLGFLSELHGATFDKVLEVRGRSRSYFGRSRDDVAHSGTHTYPQRIPKSDYWVMTNAATYQKRTIIQRALVSLGYDRQVAWRVSMAIGRTGKQAA